MDQSTAMVKVGEDEAGRTVQAAGPSLEIASARSRVLTTLPTDTDEQRVQLLSALQGAAAKFTDHINVDITVAHVTRQAVVITDQETGEVFPAIRTLLHTEGGQIIASCSGGISESLAQLAGLWGLPPWSPPLILTPRQIDTRAGHRYYILGCKGRAPKAVKKGAA